MITDATVAINDAALIPALIAGALAVSCLLVYVIGSRGRWRKSMLGVAFAGLIVVVLPIFGIIFGRRIFDAYPGYQWVALIGFTLVAVIYAVLLIVIIVEQRRGNTAPPVGKDTPAMSSTPTTGAPAIWYKAQRVLRTIVAVGIPAFLTFALVLPQIIAALGLPLSSSVYLWLVAAAAVVTAVAGAITRIMAIPAVNAFLIKIGLGSVPKSALIDGGTVVPDKAAVITSLPDTEPPVVA